MPKRKNTTRPTRNAPPRKKRKTSTPPVKRAGPIGPGLTECALKYYKAISNPWDPSAEGCCVPRHPARPSHKVRGVCRATAVIGTAGYGFALFSPTIANNKTTLLTSGSTYTGEFPGGITATTVGVTAHNISGLPYTDTQFTQGNEYDGGNLLGRIVAAGMSAQYTGTVSNMGGLYYTLVTPDHSNINFYKNGGSVSAAVNSTPETSIKRIDNTKQWIGISAIDDLELNYPEKIVAVPSEASIVSQLYPYSNNSPLDASYTTVGGAPAVIAFTGTPGNTFQIEIVIHIEVVGVGSSHSQTPSHSDSAGLEMVMGAAARSYAISVANPSASRKAVMSQALTTIMRESIPVLAPFAAGAVGMIAAGPAGAAAANGGTRALLALTNGDGGHHLPRARGQLMLTG